MFSLCIQTEVSKMIKKVSKKLLPLTLSYYCIKFFIETGVTTITYFEINMKKSIDDKKDSRPDFKTKIFDF